jgi:hypothetical protein
MTFFAGKKYEMAKYPPDAAAMKHADEAANIHNVLLGSRI